MTWEIGVTGSPFDLRELVKALQSPELTLTEEDGQFVIRSVNFDPNADASVIRHQAAELVRFIDGAAVLVLGRRQSLGLGFICRVKDDGTKEVHVSGSGGIAIGGTARVTVKRADGTEVTLDPAERVPKWLGLAPTNDTVKKVLRYLSRPLDWGTLYNIHEAIQGDMGGEDAIEVAGWATKKEQKRFTHTANNYHAIKEEARHAREDWAAPPNPMAHSEAAGLVKAIAQAWLNYKAGP